MPSHSFKKKHQIPWLNFFSNSPLSSTKKADITVGFFLSFLSFYLFIYFQRLIKQSQAQVSNVPSIYCRLKSVSLEVTTPYQNQTKEENQRKTYRSLQLSRHRVARKTRPHPIPNGMPRQDSEEMNEQEVSAIKAMATG